MFSYEELIANFFSERSEEERAILLYKLENNSLDYNARDWKDVDRSNLGNESVQLNLLFSLYEYQYTYYEGADNEILTSLEDWSDHKIYFNFLNKDQNWFYQKYYAWLGFLNFEHQKSVRQRFLLNSRFILLAVLSGKLPIIENVRNYFAQYYFVDIYKEEATVLADSLANNKNIVGDIDDKESKTIADWIKLFDAFKVNNDDTKVEEFSIQFIEVTKLDMPLKVALEYILVLYDALATNKIWKNITIRKFFNAEKVEPDTNFDPSEAYLKGVKNLPDLSQWLGDGEEVAKWLKTQSPDFIPKLLSEVKNKVNLSDENQLNLLINFSDILQEQKLITEELVYFNESDNQFHWNEKIFS